VTAPAPRRQVERIRQPIPVGIDVAKAHAKLVKLIAEKHGDGWEIESIDPVKGEAVAVRTRMLTEITAGPGDDVLEVTLPGTTKPSDGAKHAARLADAHPGYEMTRFEPWLRRALLTRVDPLTSRARQALSAALGCDPWEIQVTPRPADERGDTGFDLELPGTYLPTRHDDKLEQVATTVVGRPGWYVVTDPVKRTASIIPSDPPTFPELLPYPLESLKDADRHRTPFGRKLPAPGAELGEVAIINWAAAAFGFMAGTPGAGKSVSINDIIAGQLAAGASLAILDTRAKSVDFQWCKQFCRPGGWGCDSLEAAVTVLSMLYDEGNRRAEQMARLGYQNWLDMPPGEQFQPVLIVIDELTGLLATEKIPAGIPKTHPLAVEAMQHNLLAATLDKLIGRITAEMRFVGLRALLSTQVTNQGTGMGPALKTKLGHKFLQGTNPSETARKQAFNDPSSVPLIPDNVKADEKVSKGTGAGESEGSAPFTYKSFFATTKQFQQELRKLAVPELPDDPAPTRSQIARHSPSLDDASMDAAGGGGRGADPAGYRAEPRISPETGEALTGFAKANENRRLLAAQDGTARRKKDPLDMPAASEVTVTRIEAGEKAGGRPHPGRRGRADRPREGRQKGRCDEH
jgi:hypothetical protein